MLSRNCEVYIYIHTVAIETIIIIAEQVARLKWIRNLSSGTWKRKYVCLFRYKERRKCLTVQLPLLVHVLLIHLEKYPKDLSVKAPIRLILRVKIKIAGLILDNDSDFYPE